MKEDDMIKEYRPLWVVVCDGCGVSMLESTQENMGRDYVTLGWAKNERGMDLCPACRPDGPWELLRRVYEMITSVPNYKMLMYGEDNDL